MQKYDSYKSSGIEWIGEIPSHWEVKRLKYVAELNPNKKSSYKDSNEPVVFLPMEKVNADGTINCEIKKSAFELWNGFTYFERNDIIIAKITPCFENGKGAWLNNLETKIGFGSTEFHVLRAKSILQNYLYYITRCYDFMVIGEASMTGSAGQKRVPTEFIKEFQHAIPPLAEQEAIADYLDRKTAEIDSLISDKKQLLALYEAEKTAIINNAVTKGIKAGVAMRDSGVEWLGEIPSHWGVKKLKYVASTNDEILPETTADYFEIEYVEISGVKSGLGITETTSYNFKDAPSRARRLVKHGDILVSTVRTYLKSIAKVSNPPSNLIASTGFAVIRPLRINSDYLGYLFYSEHLIGEIISLSTGASYPAVNSSQIEDIYIPIPLEEEQLNITRHIEGEVSRIAAKVSNVNRLISLLEEYRSALISEVVTGKVRVV